MAEAAVKEIPLGFASSRLYEKDGQTYYRISPVPGTQVIMPLHGPISKIEVLQRSDNVLMLRKGVTRYTFRFEPTARGLERVRLTVALFGFLPMGVHFGDISTTDKEALFDAFSNA